MDIDNKESSTPNFDTSNQNFGSFGNRLKQARINKNLTLDDVAGELFILRRHLEAIEAEDFKELPQMAFARGFVINYAKFLGLDPEQVAESFNRNYPDELKRKSVDDIESPLKPMGTLQREGRRSIRINPLLVLGVIGLIILAVFLIRTVSNAQDASATNDQQDNSSLADELSDSEQSAGAAINTTGALSNSGSAIGVGDDAAQSATLDFWIQGDTQLNVVDASGQTLIAGEQPRGGYKLSGQPPFNIKINPASSATLNLNGTPVQLNDYIENGAANFTLAP
ncbi:RodZ domain-containing protein [Psychrobacter sp. FDAARGOS_221]|uniref:RodZ domain-containing protein n=1 Tax=Psychrobacter sp. FDAARGOS_221 TaxID=1975705 RepID=UPI000BB585CB|nr:RodZ domain-containing protein [Psychrobacter sp. FDAARGOS_221]PNK61258.1 DUF4115 domain-containing protein [Psychrobacter sp. FDAARGOS_221]